MSACARACRQQPGAVGVGVLVLVSVSVPVSMSAWDRVSSLGVRVGAPFKEDCSTCSHGESEAAMPCRTSPTTLSPAKPSPSRPRGDEAAARTIVMSDQNHPITGQESLGAAGRVPSLADREGTAPPQQGQAPSAFLADEAALPGDRVGTEAASGGMQAVGTDDNLSISEPRVTSSTPGTTDEPASSSPSSNLDEPKSPARSPLSWRTRLMTPHKGLSAGILRLPDTPGTGQSVRFGKRLYDDGEESRMSSCTGKSSGASSSVSQDALEIKNDNDSADLVEMSLMSMPQRDVSARHPYASEDGDSIQYDEEVSSPKQAPAEISTDSSSLPALEGYSNLEDISFGMDQSPQPNGAALKEPGAHSEELSFDESFLRHEVDRAKTGVRDLRKEFGSRPSLLPTTSPQSGKTGTGLTTASLPDLDFDVDICSPLTATTQASDYKSARSRASTASPYESDQAHSRLHNAHEERSSKPPNPQMDTSWENDAINSPSAMRAGRKQSATPQTSLVPSTGKSTGSLSLKEETSKKILAALADSRLSHSDTLPHDEPKNVQPSTTQANTSFLSMYHSNSSSSSFSSSFVATDPQVLRDIFKTAEELDQAHFTRSEALLRRVRSAEQESANLRQSWNDAQTSTERQRLALQEIEGLVKKLKGQLANRSTAIDQEDSILMGEIERRLAAPEKEDELGSKSPKTECLKDDSLEMTKERLKREAQQELEAEFNSERYALRREFETQIESLQAQLDNVSQKANVTDENADCAPSDSRKVEKKQGIDLEEISHNSTDKHDNDIAEKLHRMRKELDEANEKNRSLLVRLEGISPLADQAHQGTVLQSESFSNEQHEDEATIASLQQQLEELSSAKSSAVEENLRLKDELQSQWKHAERAHDTEAHLRGQIHQLEEQLEATSVRLDEAIRKQMGFDELESKVKNAQEQSEHLLVAKGELESRVSKPDDLNKKEAEHSSCLAAELAEVKEQAGASLETLNAQLRHEADGAKELRDELASMRGELANKVELLETERTEHEKAFQQFEEDKHAHQGARDEIDALKVQIGHLKSNANGLRGERDSLRGALHLAESRITDLQLEGSTMNKGVDSIREELAVAQKQVRELRESFGSAEARLQATRSAKEHLEEELGAVREREKVLSAQNEDLSTGIKELQTRLRASDGEKDSNTNRSEPAAERIEELERQLQATRRRIQALEEESSSRGLSIVKLRKAKERLEADNFNFSIALSAKQQEVSLLKRTSGRRTDTMSLVSRHIERNPEEQSQKQPLRAQNGVSSSHSVAGTAADETGDSLPPLQSGPAHKKATRRKTLEYESLMSKADRTATQQDKENGNVANTRKGTSAGARHRNTHEATVTRRDMEASAASTRTMMPAS